MNQAECWSAAPIMLEKVQFQQVNVQTIPSNQTYNQKCICLVLLSETNDFIFKTLLYGKRVIQTEEFRMLSL